jgi:HPt (histidine-containing phosphotransfer) domain-containing protein
VRGGRYERSRLQAHRSFGFVPHGGAVLQGGPGVGCPPTAEVVSTAEQAGKAAAVAVGLPLVPVVEGLDSAEGLARVAGNRKLYIKLLREFSEAGTDPVGNVRGLLESNAQVEAERAAHTLKSVAASLGAKAVAAVAGALEQGLRQGFERNELEPLLGGLAAELNPLLARLRGALGPEAMPARGQLAGEEELARLPEVVVQLARYLRESDANTHECLESNRAVVSTLFSGEDFESFAAEVNGYAFGEAAASLEKAAKAKGISIV